MILTGSYPEALMSESALGGHLLGPVRLDVDGRPVEIGSRRTRLVAAALIARAGRITGIERLADIVWRGDPPRTWLVQLQTCVMELRRAIEAAGHPSPRDVLVTVGPGYRLRLSPGCLDVERFRAATAQARALADADPTEARRRYVAAEAMCAGRAFDDVRDFGLEAEARALDELLHAARLDRLALDLRCGAAAEAIVELRGLTEAFPWQERPHALLMTALWQQRRGVEALEHFRRLRREWVRQLGIEPGGELVALQTRILLGDAAAEPVDQRVPHELPSPPSPR
jgi:DNA-binding SARP family transcriptional activator